MRNKFKAPKPKLLIDRKMAGIYRQVRQVMGDLDFAKDAKKD